jgi:predicted  nucleic acid-binding Zn-ribbon protein
MTKTAHVVSAPISTLHEKLDRRTKLQQRIDEARLEINYVSDDLGRKERAVRELDNEIAGYKQGAESNNEFEATRYRTRLQGARERYESARTELKAAQEKFSELNDEITQLERELADLRDGNGTDFTEILDLQRQIETAQTEIARIESSLEEQRRILAEAQARMQPKDDFSSQRDDLAAKVALGHEQEKSLKELDAKIAEHQQTVDREIAEALPMAEEAQSVIAGLERKLEAARNALSELEAKHAPALAMFYNSVAEVEGTRYLELARKLHDCYLKLTALNTLRGGNALLSYNHSRMLIPSFRLKAHEGAGHPREQWTLFSAQYADFEAARKKLQEDFRSRGINL